MDTQDLMGDDYTKPAPAKKDHRWARMSRARRVCIASASALLRLPSKTIKRATSLLNSIDKSIVADKKADLKQYLKDAY